MDIGTLTGQIELEDQLSGALHAIMGSVTGFASAVTEALAGVTLVVAAAVASIGGLALAITSLGERGADVNDVASTLDNFAGSAKRAEAIMVQLRAGTKGTVDDFDLMKSSTKLLAAGVHLTADQFGTLSSAAFVLQNQGLGPTKDMLDMVSQALLTGRTRALEMKIGKLDLAKAEQTYAASLGVEKLTEMQKIEAKRLGILDLLNTKVQQAGQQNRDFGEQIEFAKTAIKNWTDELSRQVAASPAVMHALESIGTALMEAFGGTSEKAIKTIIGWVNVFADTVSKAATTSVTIGKTIVSTWQSIPSIFKILGENVLIAAASVYALNTAVTLLAGTSIAKWFLYLASAVEIYGVSTGISITATYAFELATARLTTVMKGLWAVVERNPVIAVTVAIGALTLAFTSWMEAAARAKVITETLASQQQVINAAIAKGAPKTIEYADAISYLNEVGRKHAGIALEMDEAIKRLGDDTENTATGIRELNLAVLAAANAGKLSTPQLLNVGQSIKDLGIDVKTLPTALQNVVKAYDILTAKSTESTAKIETAATKAAKSIKEIATTLSLVAKGTSSTVVLNQFGEAASKAAEEGRLFGLVVPAAVAKVAAAFDAKDLAKVMTDFTTNAIKEVNRLDAEAFKKLDAMTANVAQKIIDNLDVKSVMTPFVNAFIKETDRLNGTVTDKLDGATKIYVENVMKALKAGEEWDKGLSTLAQSFSQLAQITGGGFGGLLRDIARIISATDVATKAGTEMAAGIDAIQASGGDLKSIGGAFIQISAGIMSAVAALDAATNSASRAKNVLGGAAAGAKLGEKIGGAFGPVGAGWGLIIGAVVGGIVGALRHPKWVAAMKLVGTQWGVAISDGLAKSIEATMKATGMGAVEASLLHMTDIIGEAGGVTTTNFEKLISKLHDVFSAVEGQVLTTAEATKILDENFAAFAETATIGGKMASQSLLDIIALDDRFQTHSKVVADFVKTQNDSAVAGLATYASAGATAYKMLGEAQTHLTELQGQYAKASTDDQKDIQKEIDATTQIIKDQQAAWDIVGLHSQEAATGVTAAIAGSFQLMLAQGVSVSDAVAAVTQPVMDLGAQLKAAGLGGTDAFKQLKSDVEFAASAIGGPAVAAAQGLDQTIVGLHNANALTQESFGGLARAEADLFTSLIGHGADVSQVYRFMGADLQHVWEQEHLYGMEVDDATQKVLDQAEAAGVVGQAHVSAADRAALAMEHVAATLDLIAEKFGVDLPNAIGTFGSSVSGTTGTAGSDITTNVGGALDGVQEKLKDTIPFNDFETHASTSAGNVQTAMHDKAVDGVNQVKTALNNTPWTQWANDGIHQAGRLNTKLDVTIGKINEANFGSSPGGFKEWPILIGRGARAMDEFNANFVTKTDMMASVMTQTIGHWETLGDRIEHVNDKIVSTADALAQLGKAKITDAIQARGLGDLLRAGGIFTPELERALKLQMNVALPDVVPPRSEEHPQSDAFNVGVSDTPSGKSCDCGPTVTNIFNIDAVDGESVMRISPKIGEVIRQSIGRGEKRTEWKASLQVK